MKNRIKLIIFDAYGVCLSPGYPDTCKYLAKKYRRDWKELYAVIYSKYFNQAALKKITQARAWDLAAKELDLPLSGTTIRDVHYRLMSVNSFVLKKAAGLAKKYRILLLSKNTRSQFHDMHARFPIFKKVFGRDMINTWEYDLPKASKETMDFVFKKYHAKAVECVYTDDQKVNLEVPKKLGVRTIFFKNNNQWEKELNKVLNAGF